MLASMPINETDVNGTLIFSSQFFDAIYSQISQILPIALILEFSENNWFESVINIHSVAADFNGRSRGRGGNFSDFRDGGKRG